MILSQNNDPKQNTNHKNIKDDADFVTAKKSIYNGNWVFEATKISRANTQTYLNFGDVLVYYIVNEGDSCHYKLDTSLSTSLMMDPTQNRYIEGRCKSEIISIKEDKRGNVCQKMKLTGINLKANVDITVLGRGNYVIADIYPLRAKGSNTVRYSGKIMPISESEFSKK
jgi:hypothetical protein